MEQKVFLESNRSRTSIDKESRVGIQLSTRTRLLPSDNISGVFSLSEQYNAERDACEKYRVILAVNPICSNVLYNRKTEVVRNEGSDNVTVLSDTGIDPSSISQTIENTTPVTLLQAIRDTEYSNTNNGGFVYHCGTDIFNNHMIRNDGFVHVNKMKPNDRADSQPVFNTIKDYLRDEDGNIIKGAFNPSGSAVNIPMHLYQMDTILSFEEAAQKRIKEENGWWGFTNPGNIEIPSSSNSGISVNRMMANNKSCEFIDMYPDRSLFSFVPKFNKYRNRVENNWDYCLTYPFSADTSIIDTICGGQNQAIMAKCSITHSVDGTALIQFMSCFSHTLTPNSLVNIYYYDENEVEEDKKFKKYPAKIRVASVGDIDGAYRNRYFSIRREDLSRIEINDGDTLYYKKVNNGVEAQYYARIYKKFKGFDKNGERTRDIRSDLGKFSYSENIYGDRIAQIIFTDDIDLNGLCDHRGRPVSEIYLTTIKRNAGHIQWYQDKNYNSPEVEFSHCFGKVTSGLDFGDFEGATVDYNIRCLHNINVKDFSSYNNFVSFSAMCGSAINDGVPKTIEDDITISADTFYGNIVEFDGNSYTETEISPVLHRFNTQQREIINDVALSQMMHDEIERDDYDTFGKTGDTSVEFSVKTSNYMSVSDNTTGMANVAAEGYFYNPHTLLKLREDGLTPQIMKAKTINFESVTATTNRPGYSNGIFDAYKDVERTVITIKSPTDYGFQRGRMIAFYDIESYGSPKSTVWGEITNVSGLILTITIVGTPFGSSYTEDLSYKLSPHDGKRRYYALYPQADIPTYAAFVPSMSSFVWRDFVAPSEMVQDMDLYNTAFSNGRFYIEKNINLFLRRQDPHGDYGLSKAKEPTVFNPMESFNAEEKRIDLSGIMYQINNLNNLCF